MDSLPVFPCQKNKPPLFHFISGIKSSRECAQHQQHVENHKKPGVKMLPTLQRHFQFQERVSNSIWVIQGSLLSPQRPQNCQKMALTVPREKRNEGKRRESKAGRAEQTKETGILWSQIQVLPKLGTKSSHREFFLQVLFYFICWKLLQHQLWFFNRRILLVAAKQDLCWMGSCESGLFHPTLLLHCWFAVLELSEIQVFPKNHHTPAPGSS